MPPPPAVALASSWPSGWEIPEETVPESHLHDLTIDLLKWLLLHWASKQTRPTLIARNLAVRTQQTNPRIGFDPDLLVLAPEPPEGLQLESLCLWKPGHFPPQLAIEVVSPTNAIKDYTLSPARCEHAGIDELWVLDPGLVGPVSMGRHLIQVWGRDAQGWRHLYAGSGPFFSTTMRGWLLYTGTPTMPRIADDAQGTMLWPTHAEAERAKADLEHAARETERAEKEKLAAHLRSLGIDPDAILRGAGTE